MATGAANKASLGSEDESTIKVAPTKKDGKEKSLKLKKSAPKQSKPGNWRDGSVIDDDKKKGTDTASTNSVPVSPGPIVNQLDDSAKETFATGRPLEDTPKIQTCKHCKKSILDTAITAHVISCLKAKKERAQRKKEQKEARERERKGLDPDKKEDDGDTRMDDEEDEDDASPEKKGPGGLKSTKKSAGKKIEIDDTKKGKKRKADGDAEKGPKQKKKKEEPKPKAPKPKGIYFPDLLSFTPEISPISYFYDAPGSLENEPTFHGFASAPGARTSPGWDPFIYSPQKGASRWFSPTRARRRPKVLPESSPTPRIRTLSNTLKLPTHHFSSRRVQARPQGHPSLGVSLSDTRSLTEFCHENSTAPSKSQEPTALQTRDLFIVDFPSKSTQTRRRSRSPSLSLFGIPEHEYQIPSTGAETIMTSHLQDLDVEHQSSPLAKRSITSSPRLSSQLDTMPARLRGYGGKNLPMKLRPCQPTQSTQRTRGGKGVPRLRPRPSQPASEPLESITYIPESPADTPSEGPVDVERQCGVAIKEGVQCARSLTCKSHSMGAKRAVPGRSLPYDMLLAAYQKKNQAKQQKAAIDANAPLEDEEEANGPFDSDEELQGVMSGLANWNPQPLVQPEPQIPIQRKYQKEALYEQLRQATKDFSVNIWAVKGYGYQKLQPGHPGLSMNADEMQDADGEVDGDYGFQGAVSGRRPSGFNMQMPPSRRASMASQSQR